MLFQCRTEYKISERAAGKYGYAKHHQYEGEPAIGAVWGYRAGNAVENHDAADQAADIQHREHGGRRNRHHPQYARHKDMYTVGVLQRRSRDQGCLRRQAALEYLVNHAGVHQAVNREQTPVGIEVKQADGNSDDRDKPKGMGLAAREPGQSGDKCQSHEKSRGRCVYGDRHQSSPPATTPSSQSTTPGIVGRT